MPAQFLVITGREDEQHGHVPLVAPHMGKNKLTVIDPIPTILSGQGLTFRAGGRSKPLCTCAGIALDQVAAVWDRRPTTLSTQLLRHVQAGYRGYAWSAISELSRQLYNWFPAALWLPDMYAAQRAERKSLQLIEAAKVGFLVPETIFTSDPKKAKQFVAARPATIIKDLSCEAPIIQDAFLMFFSTRVTPDAQPDYANLSIGPAILQQAIEPAYDLRITVVGSQIFPAAIVASAEKKVATKVRDWRIGNHVGDLSITACRVPAGIRQKCLALTKRLHLNFGAIDMVVDKQGNHWFLEINPNGQWGFVEEATKQPIGKAIAQLLLSGKTAS